MKKRLPDEIRLFTAVDKGIPFAGTDKIQYEDVGIFLDLEKDRIRLGIAAEKTPVLHLRLRWNFTEEEKRREPVRVMGDAWERAYGELEWRGIVPHRFLPWYMLVSNGTDSCQDYRGRFTECFGVRVRPGAICAWQYDTHGVTFWADTRCGGEGVILSGRRLEVCEILMGEYRNMSAYLAGRVFCRRMCSDPLSAGYKIYGFNNWYYAAGSSSHQQIMRDVNLLASVAEGLENRPYMVVDDGWQRNPCDGPWDRGNDRFPDMAGLAGEISKAGVVPGIWIRYLSDRKQESGMGKEAYIPGRPGVLDPSLPQVIEKVKEDTRRLVNWGYRLIKHDFSAFDTFDGYGSSMTTHMAENGWAFHDRSRTSAEITLDLYRAIREAAGEDTIILGCNTLSHLSAGLVHLMRTGYDTSGRHWERVRIFCVNALAFRLMQNGTFYVCDADCAAIAGRMDWELTREWIRAAGESGTTLFVSADPDVAGEHEKECLRKALAVNSVQADEMVPLDWMENTSPERYLVNGVETRYMWYGKEGTYQFIPPDRPQY